MTSSEIIAFQLDHLLGFVIIRCNAGVAELVDAPDSKSGDSDIVWVRVPPSVPIFLT